MTSQIIIVGSGILGLSVAEYFSRTNKNIVVISNENPLSGSYAAAANLATKGQLFGRDPHFQMKLDAKKIYKDWIQNLLIENNTYSEEMIDSILQFGNGLDVFASEVDRDRHFQRVFQGEDELHKRNLSSDFIIKFDERKIIYKNEAWVHSDKLINLLKSINTKRGVTFIKEDFSKNHYDKILKNKEKIILIFCTGPWTKNLLEQLGIPLSPGFAKSERLTIGSTFRYEKNLEFSDTEFCLVEKIQNGLKNKVTFSGKSPDYYLSSSSLRIDKIIPNESEEQALQDKNKLLKELAIPDINNFKYQFKEKKGLRIGYGHSEILIEKLSSPSVSSEIMVCCGAHKSGFLFAPVVGKKIKEILFS